MDSIDELNATRARIKESDRERIIRLKLIKILPCVQDFISFLDRHSVKYEWKFDDEMNEYLHGFYAFCLINRLYGNFKPYSALHWFYLNQDKISGPDKYSELQNEDNRYLKLMRTIVNSYSPNSSLNFQNAWNKFKEDYINRVSNLTVQQLHEPLPSYKKNEEENKYIKIGSKKIKNLNLFGFN